MTNEYAIKRIKINWAEDARLDGKEFKTIRETDAALAGVAMFKNPEGGYCKTEVAIEYTDGEVYTARIDVCHPAHHTFLGIAAHVTRFNQGVLGDLEEAAKMFKVDPADLEVDANENMERINGALALEIRTEREAIIAGREEYEKKRKLDRLGG